MIIGALVVSVNRWHYVDVNVFNFSFSFNNYVDIVQSLFPLFFRSLSLYIYSYSPLLFNLFSFIFLIFMVPTVCIDFVNVSIKRRRHLNKVYNWSCKGNYHEFDGFQDYIQWERRRELSTGETQMCYLFSPIVVNIRQLNMTSRNDLNVKRKIY